MNSIPKVGDTVKLINAEEIPHESQNWLLAEKKEIHIGDKFKVVDVGEDDSGFWMYLDGLSYGHPCEKFKVVSPTPTY